MSLETRSLPTATLHERSAVKRWIIDFAQTPRLASTRSLWAMTAGLSAGALHFLSAVIKDGSYGLLYEVGKLNLETLIACCIGAIIVTFAFFIPLWLSAAMYFTFFSTPRRTTAAAWVASFHMLAHLGLGFLFNNSFDRASYNLHVPLLIGLLWGLWLPGTNDELNEQRLHQR